MTAEDAKTARPEPMVLPAGWLDWPDYDQILWAAINLTLIEADELCSDYCLGPVYHVHLEDGVHYAISPAEGWVAYR